MPRPRERILANLESLYRESFARAEEAGDQGEMQRLDFGFRRDQLFLEAVLDVRDLLGALPAPGGPAGGGGGAGGSGSGGGSEPSLLDQVGELRKLTRFPFK